MSTRVCDELDMDCSIKCPGCALSDGGQFVGGKWTYPPERRAHVERRSKLRAIVECRAIGCPGCCLCEVI
jgi:hypothetical protein